MYVYDTLIGLISWKQIVQKKIAYKCIMLESSEKLWTKD